MRAQSSFLDSLPPLPTWNRKQQEPTISGLQAPSSRAASASASIDVSLEDRWLILGATGTGKTYFSKMLIKELHGLWPDVPVTILDSKVQGDFDDWYSMKNMEVIQSEDPPELNTKGYQIWQPSYDDFDIYDHWFGQILRVPGRRITLIDEIANISNKQGDAPRNFVLLLKQGRKPQKCVINGTQEMAYTPKQIRTQTTHVTRFRMADTGYDNQKANRIMGRPNNAPEPSAKYGFFYRRITEFSEAVEYDSAQDFF